MNLSTVHRQDHLDCQCTTTLHGENKETQKGVNIIHRQFTNYARRFPRGCWSFLAPGSNKKWYGTYSDKQDGDWDKTAERMMLNFAESGHPIFRATGALQRGELRSKEKGKKSIHFNGSEENIELILRTIISGNQLSVYGAVADLCKELSKISEWRWPLEFHALVVMCHSGQVKKGHNTLTPHNLTLTWQVVTMLIWFCVLCRKAGSINLRPCSGDVCKDVYLGFPCLGHRQNLGEFKKLVSCSESEARSVAYKQT